MDFESHPFSNLTNINEPRLSLWSKDNRFYFSVPIARLKCGHCAILQTADVLDLCISHTYHIDTCHITVSSQVRRATVCGGVTAGRDSFQTRDCIRILLLRVSTFMSKKQPDILNQMSQQFFVKLLLLATEPGEPRHGVFWALTKWFFGP